MPPISSKLTYRQLQLMLNELPETMLDSNVTVFDADNNEVYAVDAGQISGFEEDEDTRPDDDVIEIGQPYLIFSS